MIFVKDNTGQNSDKQVEDLQRLIRKKEMDTAHSDRTCERQPYH